MSTTAEANWERDVMSYLHDLEGRCSECLRRYNCANCDIARAKTLAKRKREIGSAHRKLIDKKRDPYSLRARYNEILTILRDVGRPLRAREIILRTTQSRNVKWWTLNRMVAKGLICKTRVLNFYGRPEAAYYTKEKNK